jgi:hypothetical protein
VATHDAALLAVEKDTEDATWRSRPAPAAPASREHAVDFRVSTLAVRMIGLERARSHRPMLDMIDHLGRRQRLRRKAQV